MADTDNRAGRPAGNRIVVVGGGIVGVLSAMELLKTGSEVVIIDPAKPEERCSYGNAGSLSPGSVAPLGMPGVLAKVPGMMLDRNAPLRINHRYVLRVLPWLTRFVLASGSQNVERISFALHALLHDSIELYHGILKEIGALDLMQRRGQLQLYPDRRMLKQDAGVWSLRRARGVAVEEVGRDEIRQLEPEIGPRYECGIFLPNEGMVTNPARLVEVLTESFLRSGGQYVTGRATGFAAADGRANAVLTNGGPVAADAIVIAAGAWSRELARMAGDDVPLQTQRGYHVTFPDLLAPLNRPVVAADRKIFVTPLENGMRVAGTVEFDSLDAPPDPARAAALLTGLPDLLPNLAMGSRTEWMGHRPCMPDSLPVIGQASELRNVFHAFGNGHLGLTGAPRVARLITDLVQGRRPCIDPAPYRANRF